MSIVHLPEELAGRLAAEADRRGITVDELAAEALGSQFPEGAPAAGDDALEAFIGSGHSGRGDLSRQHRHILADAISDDSAADV